MESQRIPHLSKQASTHGCWSLAFLKYARPAAILLPEKANFNRYSNQMSEKGMRLSPET